MAIARATTGLLFRESFDSLTLGAQPAGWTKLEGSAHAFTVVNAPGGLTGRSLRGNPAADGDAFLTRDAPADESDIVAQARLRASSAETSDNVRPGLAVRFGGAGDVVLAWLSHWKGDAPEGLHVRSISGGVVQVASAAFNFVPAGVYILRLAAVGANVEARVYTSAGAPVVSATIPNANRLGAGNAGVYGIAVAVDDYHWDDFDAYRDTRVITTGLPAGYSAQLKNGAGEIVAGPVLADANGRAEIPYDGLFPLTSVEFLDGAEVIDVGAPADGVWGGDTFPYQAAPDAPVCTVEDITAYGATLISSAFSDPNLDSAHAASRWQVDQVGGDFSAPLVDSGRDEVNLLSFAVSGIEPASNFIGRVQHEDSSGLATWSDPVPFSTVRVWDPCGGAPATAWAPCVQPGPAPAAGLFATFYDRDGQDVSVIDESDDVLETAVFEILELSDYAPGGDSTEWNAVIEGFILAPEAGDYTFYLTVDDGARVYIDGVLVRAADIVSGDAFVVALPAYAVPIRIEHWQVTLPEYLLLEWESLTLAREIVPASAVSTVPLWKPCAPKPATAWGSC